MTHRKIEKLPFLLICVWLTGCAARQATGNFGSLRTVGRMELRYAEQFRADYLEGGCVLVTVESGGRFLIVPEGKDAPPNTDGDIAVLRRPVENIYLAATSAMCLFDALGALEHITMSSAKAEGWRIENAKAAMESGAIVYAGKYSAPDYELIAAAGCGLAIFSTMIYHAPEVKEKLEDLGVPVLTERSSYETHPLGRTEWIKLYGLLFGKEELAGRLFDEQAAYLDGIAANDTGKSAAFFYISASGGAVTRSGGDYAAKMIRLAGGNYVFADLGSPGAAGSVSLDMEQFYARARDADFIIYNGSVGGQVGSVSELLEKSPLFADFKAVKNGDVWCTGTNFFQETTGVGLMISEMRRIFADELNDYDKLSYFRKLE